VGKLAQVGDPSSFIRGLAQITFCGAKALWRFDKRECLSLKQAADVAGKSEFTMRGWCDNVGWDGVSAADLGGQLAEERKTNKLARWKRALLCENVSSTAITLEQYWPHTAFWLAFHGFVKPEALDREANRRYSITPTGETQWSRIAVKAWAQACSHGGPA
jgi:hypothetical protein